MKDVWQQDYQYALIAAIIFHLLIVFALIFETHSASPVLRSDATNQVASPR